MLKVIEFLRKKSREFNTLPNSLPSLRAQRSNLLTSPAGGEGLHRPWCHKILGTRPRMTGGRGANSSGRSMIEMLGVLAIIAVLSVGGIAGYSNAMEKYKLLKFREGMIELVSNFLLVKDELKYESGENTWTRNYPEILRDMNLLPAGYKLLSSTVLSDQYGHSLVIIHDGRPGENHFNFGMGFENSKKDAKLCHELLEVAVAFRDDIWQLFRQPTSDSGIPFYFIYGNKFCRKGVKCMSNLTISDIEEICYYYQGKPSTDSYRIQFSFKN